jgi:aspartyl/asparaginyl beta-hydroxylase (cupin superfamily)
VHQVENNGKQRRILLFMDIERKFLPGWLERMNTSILKATMNSPYIIEGNKKAEQVHDSSPRK